MLRIASQNESIPVHSSESIPGDAVGSLVVSTLVPDNILFLR